MYLTWELAPSSGPELKITQGDNVLLKKIFFLDSMVKIVTNLAWGPVSQIAPLITQQQHIEPREHSGNRSPWLILCQAYLRTYALGKGLVELLQTLRYSFHLFSAASWGVHKTLLKPVRPVLASPLLMSTSEDFSVTFTLNKIYTKLWVTETVFGPWVKSSPSETTNLGIVRGS